MSAGCTRDILQPLITMISFHFLQFERLEEDSMVSRRSRDLAGQELVVLVEGQPPYVQFGTERKSVINFITYLCRNVAAVIFPTLLGLSYMTSANKIRDFLTLSHKQGCDISSRVSP